MALSSATAKGEPCGVSSILAKWQRTPYPRTCSDKPSKLRTFLDIPRLKEGFLSCLTEAITKTLMFGRANSIARLAVRKLCPLVHVEGRWSKPGPGQVPCWYPKQKNRLSKTAKNKGLDKEGLSRHKGGGKAIHKGGIIQRRGSGPTTT